MPSMLAVEAHERGGAESLHVERVDRPEPSRGEALVEVHAAGITPTELTWDTTWTTEDGRGRLPTIPSHEASGVVLQLGRHAGAAVIGVASALDEQLVQELGAHGVRRVQDPALRGRRHRGDVVFDTIGGDVQRRLWKVLKPGGTLVSIVAQPSAELAEEHHAHGVMFIVEPNRDDLTSIANLVDNGELTPIVSAVFPLAEGPTAYVMGLHDHVPGKIVLDVRAGGRPTDLQTSP